MFNVLDFFQDFHPMAVVFVGLFFAKLQKRCPEFTVGGAFEARRIWNACLANRQAAGVQLELQETKKSSETPSFDLPMAYHQIRPDLDLKLVVNYNQNRHRTCPKFPA